MNLHKKYYKDYFGNIGLSLAAIEAKEAGEKLSQEAKERVERVNRDICSVRLLGSYTTKIDALNASLGIDESNSFKLETLYPGLLTGVGLLHEAGMEGELKLGVHLDYTSGMPVVYGSSIKGVLSEYLCEYLPESVDGFDACKEIFEGLRRVDGGGVDTPQSARRYEPLPMAKRDVFFDAVIVASNRDGKIVDQDTICPHTDGALKNPKPIGFLKIASGVTILFRFRLHDGVLSAADKLKLFKEILLDFGVGAKTNVGYGQFKEVR